MSNPHRRIYVRDGFTFVWDEARHVVGVTDEAKIKVGHFYTSPGDTYPMMLDLADEWLDEWLLEVEHASEWT